MKRCPWATTPELIAYHDAEWGVPLHDDRRLFELLVLEGQQAGLSWATVLRKRERYRERFAGFDPVGVASMSRRAVESCMRDPGLIRNRAKIESAVTNAKAFLLVQREFTTFDAYLWQFVGGRPVVNRRKRSAEIPASTPQSQLLSKDLRRRGFVFVGPTICYAFMQAAGLVNDHLIDCAFHDRRPGSSRSSTAAIPR